MVTPEDVTLFTSGLFPALLARLGIAPARGRAVSLLLLPVVAWVPLVVFTAIAGTLLPGGAAASPFVRDLAVHARLLAVLPLLIVAGVVAERRIEPCMQEFATRRLVPDAMQDRFQAAIASTFRMGASIVPDVVALVLIYGIGAPLVWHVYTSAGVTTWFATSQPGSRMMSPAGFWYVFVALPILQFVMLRWYYRLFLWGRFLWLVSRMNLELVAPHPDRLGGLGFLVLGTQGLATFAMAHGALLAGWIGNRVLFGSGRLPDFRNEAVTIVAFVLVATVSPLFAFTPALIRYKLRGVMEYGALASRYVYGFDRKWLRGGAGDERLVGSSDVQSLADMGGSYELVDRMRRFPLSLELLATLVLSTLLPVAPLLLTVMPIEEILKKLAGILV